MSWLKNQNKEKTCAMEDKSIRQGELVQNAAVICSTIASYLAS
jgi:hypothetical protein